MSDEPLHSLDTFLRAAELESFTAAAQELGVSQAAVSQRIHGLEGQLGLSLFTRIRSRVQLTENGRILHGYAQKILSLHKEARAKLTGQPCDVTGELPLVASSIPGEHLLPEILAKFGHDYPKVQVRVHVTDSQQVLECVAQGEAHLGLVGMKSEESTLEFLPIAKDELLVIVAPTHPWKSKREIELDALRDQPLIVREAGSGSRKCLETALNLAKHPLSRFHVSLEMDSNEAIKRSVQQGLGIAILSELAVRSERQAKTLVGLSVKGLSLHRELYLVRDPRRVLPKPAELFVRAVLPPQKS